jgi:hypothetical protein
LTRARSRRYAWRLWLYRGQPRAQIWHSGGMESRVDLDQVAGLISRHAFAWKQSGLVVGALTWRDEAAPWPSPLREDRGQVAEPDSVGATVRKDQQEGQLVVFRGGWADLEYWGGPSDKPVLESPGWGAWMDLPGI